MALKIRLNFKRKKIHAYLDKRSLLVAICTTNNHVHFYKITLYNLSIQFYL